MNGKGKKGKKKWNGLVFKIYTSATYLKALPSLQCGGDKDDEGVRRVIWVVSQGKPFLQELVNLFNERPISES